MGALRSALVLGDTDEWIPRRRTETEKLTTHPMGERGKAVEPSIRPAISKSLGQWHKIQSWYLPAIVGFKIKGALNLLLFKSPKRV